MPNRPLSITLVAWVFIVAGTVGILYHAGEFDRNHPLAPAPILACLVRLLAVVGGAYLLRGRSWARWLLVAWLAFHVVLSAFHNLAELVMHAVLLVVIAWLLFRPVAAAYFRRPEPTLSAS